MSTETTEVTTPPKKQVTTPEPIKTTYTGTFSDRTENLYIDPKDPTKHKLVVQYYDKPGRPDEYTGEQAIINASMENPYTTKFRINNPEFSVQGSKGARDYRDTISYSLSRKLTKSLADGNPGFFGKNFNTPFTASVAGAALGGAGLTLTHWLARTLGFLDEDSDPLWPGIIGAGLGAGLGYFSNKHNVLRKEGSYMQKQASLYQDPRNFILEKLQRSSDLSLVDKAMLANKVRNMDRMAASELEKIVRSALGIGVGVVIAKFFGLGTLGTAMGGMLGVLGANMTGFGNSIFR